MLSKKVQFTIDYKQKVCKLHSKNDIIDYLQYTVKTFCILISSHNFDTIYTFENWRLSRFCSTNPSLFVFNEIVINSYQSWTNIP